jgi:hypothetical protein
VELIKGMKDKIMYENSLLYIPSRYKHIVLFLSMSEGVIIECDSRRGWVENWAG